MGLATNGDGKPMSQQILPFLGKEIAMTRENMPDVF